MNTRCYSGIEFNFCTSDVDLENVKIPETYTNVKNLIKII
jgi:hypothetical protein